MERRTGLVLFTLLAMAIGCGSSKLGDGGTGGTPGAGGTTPTTDAGYVSQLAAAQATWAAAKPSCPAYRYQSRETSVFGMCATTTIEIADDQAVSRSFLESARGCSPAPDGGGLEQWSELGAAQIGTHPDGDAARTVEQLAEACRQILALDPARYRLFFSADTHGVPTQCTATLISCVDDCTSGIEIPSFACKTSDAGTD